MDPFKKFNLWYNQAKKKHPFDHTAFALSTCLNNKPEVRIILLKKILKDGLYFNYETFDVSHPSSWFKVCIDISTQHIGIANSFKKLLWVKTEFKFF